MIFSHGFCNGNTVEYNLLKVANIVHKNLPQSIRKYTSVFNPQLQIVEMLAGDNLWGLFGSASRLRQDYHQH